MKKLIITLILSSTLLVGCSNNKDYENAIETGINALNNNSYQTALDQFNLALEEKNTDKKAKTLYTQTKNLISGIKYYEENKLDKSLEYLMKVKDYPDGNEILIKKSDELIKKIDSIKEKKEQVNNYIKSANNNYNNKSYELALNDVNSGLNLINKENLFIYESNTLEKLKTKCENSIRNQREIENQKNLAQSKENEIQDNSISQSQAISILSDYISSQVGYVPNSIEVYETLNGKYHLTASHYDESGSRGTFGWFWVDMNTGEVTR